jgi:uncharacterized spore protein YtfJ
MTEHETYANATPMTSELTAGLGRLTDVGADRVFREPVHAGDRVIVTASALDFAGGMGVGSGTDNEGGGGGGGGLGGRFEGRPVAAIEIGPDGVNIRPIVDFTRIGVTIAIGAFAVWRAASRR